MFCNLGSNLYKVSMFVLLLQGVLFIYLYNELTKGRREKLLEFKMLE